MPVPGPPRRPLPRRNVIGWLAVALLTVGIFGTGIGLGQATGAWELPSLFSPKSRPPSGPFPVLEPSQPTRLLIPSIGVRAPVQEVGLTPDGTIAIPAVNFLNEAGWYNQGPTPGQYGPAILVGHVDTKDKPAVFARIRELKPGARIEVTRRDRQVAVFEVNSVESFSKTKIPMDRIYNDFSRPGLRLITCGGRWVGGELGYADNIVAFASIVSTHRA